ncbi:anthranilate synthase component I [Marchantia polymorpha subsp. ruderalis]|uniref:anthranilate synthase n=1 Tax=Marchantia polymorpha TaxID=3197 RepID=A0A2R6XB18_MARPO|nr:hypothetical protein MARPO_0025s0009 [Marchantia polymorpha]BBN03831.1 hypothetical protein Mp_2g26760 [Marchantia polymorpha subsp. ruderalis]|eukprot:PTQ43303.1 hypothetical protein MARPO_0025s0009 [Marchantia polymorpha]
MAIRGALGATALRVRCPSLECTKCSSNAGSSSSGIRRGRSHGRVSFSAKDVSAFGRNASLLPGGGVAVGDVGVRSTQRRRPQGIYAEVKVQLEASGKDTADSLPLTNKILELLKDDGDPVNSASSDSGAVDRAEFLDAAKKGNLVPVYRRIFSDQLTPVMAYRILVNEDERDAPSFLFESVEHATYGSSVGRFSMLGAQPAMEIIAKENILTILNHEDGFREEKIVDDPMNAPSEITDQWKPVMLDGLPEVFCGGWVGYFSYDTMRYVERKKLPFSHAPEDDRGLPDIHLSLYKDVVIFDHVSKLVYAIHWVQTDSEKFKTAEDAYENGKAQLARLVNRLQNGQRQKLSTGAVGIKIGHYWDNKQVSNLTEEEYKANIVKAKEHILAGDIFQIVLSQRFERRTFADPFEVYRALRIVNPSPYMIYLQARGSIMVGASPEILTRIQKGKVVNRPLAGTRRRGKTVEEDLQLEADLRQDKKEVAEHVMLVDLGRNDVGKVSKPGSVKVDRLMDVERYSHVMHLSSTVTGELLDDMKSWDALRAALPVGTVSGAPKVRAMELIDELEPTRRGPYSGGIGHVSFNGDMDIALALRTMIFPTFDRYNTLYSHSTTAGTKNRREWQVYLQAGAGIVADSNPDSEHRECINKAAGLSRAIDLAESAFIQQ